MSRFPMPFPQTSRVVSWDGHKFYAPFRGVDTAPASASAVSVQEQSGIVAAGGGWINGLTKKGKSTGNHRFSHEIWDFPVIFPLNQSIDFGENMFVPDATHGACI